MRRKVIDVIPGLLIVGTGGTREPEADVRGSRIRPSLRATAAAVSDR